MTPRIKSILRGAFRGAGIAVLLGVSYCTFLQVTAQSRLRAVCSEIKPGTSLTGLSTFASAHGLRTPMGNSGDNYLPEFRTFNRSGCRVTIDRGVVTKSVYEVFEND